MVKSVFLLQRKEGWSHEEFVDYWLETHAPIASDIPGLERYVTSIPPDPEGAAYDGIAELWFEDEEAMATGFDSEQGQRTFADGEEFIDTDRMVSLTVEETVHVDSG